MGRDRQNKIIMIAVLCVAMIGLSVGFAAFSNRLTISSSAEVLPDAGDFKVTIWGLDQDIDLEHYDCYYEDTAYYNSTTKARGLAFGAGVKATDAIISNSNSGISISNLSASFANPGDTVMYYFLVKNEGEYDVYLKSESIDKFPSGFSKSCSIVGETTPALVEAACEGISIYATLYNSSWREIMGQMSSSGSYKIPAGGYVWFPIILSYSSSAARADGEFNVVWEEVPLTFSTTA